MSKSFFSKYITEIVLLVLFFHAFLPFLSPILFSINENSPVATSIQKVYSYLCHQRLDRSLFLFGGEDSQLMYTLDDLKDRGYIPEDAKKTIGHSYWGNSEIGYKVAFCIRDSALYPSFIFFGFLLLLYMNVKKKIPKFHWGLILALLLPMAIDGVFQTFASFFDFPWVPAWYMASNLKRIITGILFGMGIAMFIFPNLKDAVGLGYNEEKIV